MQRNHPVKGISCEKTFVTCILCEDHLSVFSECFVSEDKFKEADIISHIPPAIVKMNERVTLRCKEPYIDSFTYSTCAGEDLFTPHYPPCRRKNLSNTIVIRNCPTNINYYELKTVPVSRQ